MSTDGAISPPAEVLGASLRLPCGFTLPNRIAKAAMSETLATPDGAPSEALGALYGRFAAGGAGLLVTGNVMVAPDGIGDSGNVIVDTHTRLADFEAWARASGARHTATFVQINHAGRQSPRGLNRHPVAPSAVPLRAGGLFRLPRALSIEEIERLVEAFARAAVLAREAGFAGVQIHAAHGYLISQFLSPRTNRREDCYGGALENRMRFLFEVLRAVRDAVGSAFPVSVKLNSADFLRGGFSPEEAVVVARALDREGVDLLEVSGGTYERPAMLQSPRESTTEREAHFLEYARTIRREVTCPVMLTGGLRTPAVMAKVVAEGGADAIGLARPIALEPDLPAQILAGRDSPALCPVRTRRFALLSAAVDGAWYQEQLHRLAHGQVPDRTASRWRALATSARSFWSGRPRL